MSDARIEAVTIRVNGEIRPLGSRLVSGLLRELSLEPRGAGVAVAVNGEIVSRGNWGTHELHPDDEVEIVGAVQGG
jgi:thiamine biosynthesis protein ThiS